MSTDLARLDLPLRRRGTIGYALGMAVYMFVVVALYPAFKNDVSLDQFTEGKSMVAALYVAFRNLSPPPAFTANLVWPLQPSLDWELTGKCPLASW